MFPFLLHAVTRRKSASEQLAESKSRYIRSRQKGESESRSTTGSDKPDTPEPNTEDGVAQSSSLTNAFDGRMKHRETPPFKYTTTQDDITVHHDNHVIMEHQHSVPVNKSTIKKRISPRLSETSTASSNNGQFSHIPHQVQSPSSNLELQLRELLSLDSTGDSGVHNSGEDDEDTTTTTTDGVDKCNSKNLDLKVDDCYTNPGKGEAASADLPQLTNIYRAELKYIGGSSSSSLSSMYSEPPHPSLSPIDDSALTTNKSTKYVQNKLPVHRLAPPVDRALKRQQKQHFLLARSKSVNHAEDGQNSVPQSAMQRLFTTPIPIKSTPKQSISCDIPAEEKANDPTRMAQNKKVLNPLTCSMHNLSTDDKPRNLPAVIGGKLKKKIHGKLFRSISDKSSMSPSSSPTTSLSSLNSSQISLPDHQNGLGKLSEKCKSTSKLTIENLMLHQQALTPTRSCHNLAALANHHQFPSSGPSVVERNARIIKWLFQCRKAMTGPCPSPNVQQQLAQKLTSSPFRGMRPAIV